MAKTGVIGAGSWGTALALVLHNNGHEVTLWSHSAASVESLLKNRELKDKLPEMSEQEQLELLATDGMLVKRPLIIGENFVLVGFKEAEWEKLK